MARPAKLEVSAVNIRIPSDKKRDYVELLSKVQNLKRGFKIAGSTFLAVTEFNKASRIGVFSKYTEIDLDGDWFDVDDFGIASPEKVDDVRIPESLRPNYSAFFFRLDEKLHLVSFEAYSDSKSLSASSVEKYFRLAFGETEILEAFGRVEADTVKSYDEVERILSLPQLKELVIKIRRPNSDDLSGDFAHEIERLLEEQNGEEYEQGLRSKDNDGLKPNSRTQALARVAAENGEVFGKNIENGILVPHSTSEKPQRERDTYNKEVENSRAVFLRLSNRLSERVDEWRQTLRTTGDDRLDV